MARKFILIDRGPENRQHGNKPYFTRVSLSFSAGNTAATVGNMLLEATDWRRWAQISRSGIKIRIRITIRIARNGRLICGSGKSATRQQMLIVNDLAGNKIGNRPATSPLH